MTARKTNGELSGIDTKGYGLFDTLPVNSIYTIDTLGIYAVRNISKSDDTLNRRFPHEFRITKIDTAQKLFEGTFFCTLTGRDMVTLDGEIYNLKYQFKQAYEDFDTPRIL